MSQRQTIHVEGFSHVNPIPAAARVGPLLMSGLINGTDPATGKPAATLEEQCRHMFAQMSRIVEAGGGSTDDIVDDGVAEGPHPARAGQRRVAEDVSRRTIAPRPPCAAGCEMDGRLAGAMRVHGLIAVSAT